MQQIYGRAPMPKCDTACFQNTIFLEHIWVAASVFLIKI